MSDGTGAAISAVASIVNSLIPKTTNTVSNGSGSSSSSSEQDVSLVSNQYNTSNTLSDTKTTSNTANSSDSFTANSADPEVIANLKALAAQATANSTDPSKTSGLITGILQAAGDAMTSIFGAQKTAGGYAGGTSQVLANDTNARAAADAASAVLGYRTNQQTLASDALSKLLTATATSDTKLNSDSTTNTDVVGDSTTSAAQSVYTTSQSRQNSNQNTASTSSSTSKTSASIVCTWMFKHGYLPRADYIESMRQFHKLHPYTIEGYLLVANYLFAELERAPDSLRSKIILWVFTHRTNWVCGRKTISGALGFLVVGLISFLPAVYYLCKQLLDTYIPIPDAKVE